MLTPRVPLGPEADGALLTLKSELDSVTAEVTNRTFIHLLMRQALTYWSLAACERWLLTRTVAHRCQ